jgi:hypothetical protein
VLLLGAGCGDGGGGEPAFVVDQPLSGQIELAKGTFATGVARQSGGARWITLYSAPSSCSDTPGTETISLYDLPFAVGTYRIGVTPNLGASFSGIDVFDATAGVMDVYAVTTTTISGGANIVVGTDVHPFTAADGRFEAVICP